MIKLINLFSIRNKFLLVGLIFGSFFTYSTIFTIIPKHKEINKIHEIQKNGLSYIKQINKLIIQTQKLRGITNIYLNDVKSSNFDIEKQTHAVIEAKNNLQLLNNKIGTKKTNIEVSEILDNLVFNINQISNQSSKLTFDAYTHIIENLLSLISFINYEYLLHSNSNNEIQILLDLYVNNIPIIIESLGKTRGITSGLLATNNINQDKKENIKQQINLIKFNDKQIEIKIETLFKYNKYLKKQLNNNILKISHSAQKYYYLYNNNIINNDYNYGKKITSNDFFNASTEIIEEYNEFLQSLYSILLKEITIKKTSDTNKLESDLLINILMAVFSTIIFYFLYINFVHYINKIKNAERTKSNFLSNMSHEIRTPLNAILGFITLLKEEEKDPGKLEYIRTIQSSSATLLNIINDILDFSKIESTKLDIVPVTFNPHKEFHDLLNLFKANAKEKEIDLRITICKELPKFILTDSLRIRQITSNLLSNAIKFTDKKSIVSLKIRYNIKKNRLFVSIRDNGIGIAKNKHKEIFKVFSQSDNSITRKYGGTGLGLSISAKLIELLGGSLKLKSSEGKGSIFYFRIPAANVVKIKKHQSEIDNQEIKKNEIEFDSKVLLVEDNEANQMFMKIILKKYKLKIDLACDGIEAVQMFTHNKYDLVLMDENMPHKNGIEATKDILAYEQENNLIHTPIVALTANALQGDKEKLLNSGMDEYLSKPLNKEHLLTILNKYLK